MIRYRKLGYVELRVGDLERSSRFYEEIVGMQPAGRGAADEVLLRCDAEPYSVVLHEGGPPGFRRAGWMLEDGAQFESLHRSLRDAGVAWRALSATECSDRQLGAATRIVEPNTQAVQEFYVPASGAARAEFEPSHTKIQRLGHVVFSTPRRAQAVAFFRDVLGFRESDSIGEGVTFMRPYPSPFHHGLGLAQGDRELFHHLNFMVTEIDDVGRGLNRLARNQVPIVFGPGRHIASGSVFLYYLDPDGMTLEYSFGMEEFSETDPRAAQVLPMKPESIDSWGAIRDPRMNSAGEIDRTTIGAA